MTPKQETIHGDELEKLTGLSDRRHRQIAKAGYFPPPVKGMYQLVATLRGMFKYYQESTTSTMKEKKIAEEHRKLFLANEETEGRLTDTDLLSKQIGPALSAFKDLLYQKLGNEIPISMAGVDVPQARIIGNRYAGELLEKMQAAFRKWKV